MKEFVKKHKTILLFLALIPSAGVFPLIRKLLEIDKSISVIIQCYFLVIQLFSFGLLLRYKSF